MKTILIIEDDPRIVKELIANLGIFLFPFNQEDVIKLLPTFKKEIEKSKKFNPEKYINYILFDKKYDYSFQKLKKNGVQIEVADNTKDAKEKYLKLKPDVIVLDGNIRDGSTNDLFQIFDNKETVLPHSNGMGFLSEAHSFGFTNCFSKNVNDLAVVKKIAQFLK